MDIQRFGILSIVVTTGLLRTPAYGGIAAGTAFTYQGQIKEAGVSLTEQVDLLFELYDAENGGEQVGLTQVGTDVSVVNGLFTVELDFGAEVFNGVARWLEVAVRIPHDPTDTEPFTLLSPRQSITGVPYALQTRGIFVDENENVGIGTTAPDDILHVRKQTRSAGTPERMLILDSHDDPNNFNLTIGSGSGILFKVPYQNDSRIGASIDAVRSTNAELNSATDLVFSISQNDQTLDEALRIKRDGNVGIGTTAPEVPLHVQGASDASPTGGGIMQVGSQNGPNVVIDRNEIMARNNGETSNLHLNNNGGDVIIGGAIDIGYQIVTHTEADDVVSVECPPGKRALGGGCQIDGLGDIMLGSRPTTDGTGWSCAYNQGVTGRVDQTAFAICARIK